MLDVSQVSALYIALLGRAPDQAGMDFWLRGSSVAEVAASMLASEEGEAAGADLVGALFQQALGRAPSAAERSAWIADADIGTQVAGFLTSIAQPVPAQRPADMSEADYAQAVADRAVFTNKQTVATALTASSLEASPELSARLLATVGADPASVTVAEARLAQGATPYIAELYVALLGRAPDADGLAWWAEQLQSGMSLDSIATGMLASSEAGTADLDTFLASLYSRVLGRDADAEGLAFWREAVEQAGGDLAARARVTTEMLAALSGPNAVEADANTLSNKVEAGLYFAASEQGNNLQLAGRAVADVDGSPESLEAAKGLVDRGGQPAEPTNPTTPTEPTTPTNPTEPGTPPGPTPPSSAPIEFLPIDGATQGGSDASTALALNDKYMIVGDDEAGVLRLYDRAGGKAIKEFALDAYLEQTKELDIEGSTKLGDALYFIGSHGNNKSGNDQNNREWIARATVEGTGADTTLDFDGKYFDLETALATWDSSNAHNLGANHFGLTAAAAAGTPESTAGLGIEGLTGSKDNSELWIGFRAPVTGGAEQQALIVTLTNPDDVLGVDQAAPVFGTPILLDLGGRGIRSIDKNAAGEYLIIAGPSGTASEHVADNFRLYTWSGEHQNGMATGLVQRNTDLDALLEQTGGSFETIVDLPASLAQGGYVQLLQDNGDTIWPGQTKVSKDLDEADQKFVGNWVSLGAPAAADSTGPLLVASNPPAGAERALNGTVIDLFFNEPVRAGAGSFTVQIEGGESFDLTVGSPAVRFEYNRVSLDLGQELPAGVNFTISAGAGALTDATDNDWVGVSGDDALDFRTLPAPSEDAALDTGDIAFVAVSADQDAFAFALLKDVAAGTVIRFTDKEWDGTGFTDKEGNYTWTAESNLTAGTVVTVQPAEDVMKASTGVLQGEGGGLGKGEQIIAMTGTLDAPGTFLAAVGFGDEGGLSDTPSENENMSLVPPGLTLGQTAIDLKGQNAVYTGDLVAGTPAELRAALADPANWTLEDLPLQNGAFPLAYPGLAVDGPSSLQSGDIMFIGMGADGVDSANPSADKKPDVMGFTFMRDIGEGTEILFTDRDYSLSTNMPASGEAAYKWTADKPYMAGDVIHVMTDDMLASGGTLLGKGGGLKAEGETIYAFQGVIDGLATNAAGAISVDRFLGAIHTGEAGAGDTPAGIQMQSFVESNAFYTAAFDASDITAYRVEILDTSNWAVGNDVPAGITWPEVELIGNAG